MSTTDSSKLPIDDMLKALGLGEEFREGLTKFMEEIQKSSPVLAGSIMALGTGCYLLMDDAKDLFKFDTPNHPSPLHHWQYGLAMLLGGTFGMGVGLLDYLKKNPPKVKLMPEGLEEQGVPVEELKAMT